MLHVSSRDRPLFRNLDYHMLAAHSGEPRAEALRGGHGAREPAAQGPPRYPHHWLATL